MPVQEFKIKKQGNYFVAFDIVDKKRSYGQISIKTGKFIGDTRCLVALSDYWDKEVYDKREAFYDKVLNQIKEDVNSGDVTAIYELIKFLPIKVLETYLPETLN